MSEECPVAIEGTAEEEEEAERQEWELSGAGEEAAKVPPPAAAAIAKKTQKKLNWGFGATQKHNSQASTNVAAAAAAREDYWRRTRTRDSIANTPLLCPDPLTAYLLVLTVTIWQEVVGSNHHQVQLWCMSLATYV